MGPEAGHQIDEASGQLITGYNMVLLSSGTMKKASTIVFSIATTLDIYSHTVPGLQKAAAERLDTLLPKVESEENVGKLSAKGEGVERRPYRSRTCDTLIKSQVLNSPRVSILPHHQSAQYQANVSL